MGLWGVDFQKALRPLLSPCPVAGLGLACDAEFNTFSFSAGFPFYQIKSALFLLILNVYFFKQLIISGGVQDLLVLACGTLLPDQESHLDPVHWEHRVLVDHHGSLYLFIFIFLFLSVLGLHYCAGFSLVLMSGGRSLTALGPLVTVVSCYRAWALAHLGLSS